MMQFVRSRAAHRCWVGDALWLRVSQCRMAAGCRLSERCEVKAEMVPTDASILGATGAAGPAPAAAESAAPLARVGRDTINQRVYAELRRSLIHGAFDAGE